MQAVQMVNMNMMRGPPPGPRGPPPRGPMMPGPRGSPGSMGQGPRSYYNPRLPLQQQNRGPGNYGSYRQRMEANQNQLFDGKRMRKAVHRKTVDYNSSVIKYLENRVWQRDFRDSRQIQPDRLYTLDLVPPPCMLSNPMNSVTTKFVRTSTNKVRCPVFVLTWTPEGRRLVTGASSGEFTLWNGLTFNFETILQAHDTSVRAMQWSHNDMWMVTADHAGFIKYWQTNMNNVKMYQGHKEAVRGISFCPTDSKFATCSDDGTVRVWDFMRCHEEKILRGHGSDVKCVDWHPLKGIIASGSKDSQQPVKLWDPKSGNSLATIHGHKSTVMSLKWNKNGNWLLTASRDHLLKLFDIRNMKEEMQTFKGHKKEATAAAWHPIHESLFASGGSDGAIMFWLVGTDKEVGGMEEAHEGMVWTLAWHPLGHILASGSNDHSTKFWTRNRPGDMMRDKYNLNTLPAGTEQELLEYDLEPQNVPAIPGMGLEHGLPDHLKPKEEPDDNLPSIPGLNWIEDETFYKQQELANLPKKKIPFSRPVPKSFEMAWKENRLPPKMANPPPKEDHRPPPNRNMEKNQPHPPHPNAGNHGNQGNPNNHGNAPPNRGPPPGMEGILGPPNPGMFRGPNQFPGNGPDGGKRPGPPGGGPQHRPQDLDERRGNQRMGPEERHQMMPPQGPMGPGGQGQMGSRGPGQMGPGGPGQMGPGGQGQMGPGGRGQMGPGGQRQMGPGGQRQMGPGGQNQMGPGGQGQMGPGGQGQMGRGSPLQMGPGGHMGPRGQGQMVPGGQGQMGPGGQGQMGPREGQKGPGSQHQMGPGVQGQMGPGRPGGPRGPGRHPGGPQQMQQQGPGGPQQIGGPNLGQPQGQRASEDEDLRRRDQDFRQQPANQEHWQRNQRENYGGNNQLNPPQDKDFRNKADRDFRTGDQDMRLGDQSSKRGSNVEAGREGRTEEFRDYDERHGGGRGGGARGGGVTGSKDTDYRFSQQNPGYDQLGESWDNTQSNKSQGGSNNTSSHGYGHGMRGQDEYENFGIGDRDERANREQSPHQRGTQQFGQSEGMRKRTYDEGPGRGRGNSTPNMSHGGSFRGHPSNSRSDNMDTRSPKYGRHDSPTDFSGRSQRPNYNQSGGRGRGTPRGRGDYRGHGYRGGSGRGGPRGQ